MPAIDSKIKEFILEHHVLTLATCKNNQPYCSSMFYVSYFFNNDEKLELYFTSEDHTRHIQEAKENNQISGAIALETTMIGKIQGIQFTGCISPIKEDESPLVRKRYLKKFPIAALSKLYLWKIEIDFIKLTDNRLGFGKKLIWHIS